MALKKDQIYEIEYAGPASSIQVCGHNFSKNRKAYLKGSDLQKINLKQWGLTYKEVKEIPPIEERLGKVAVIWTGKYEKTMRVGKERIQFPSNKKIYVTKEQLKIISKRSEFKIVE